MLTLMMLAFGGIVVRLAFLQVRDNPELEALGLQQRVRTITLPARRGEIVDRSGVPLAVTREARDVYVDPRYVVDARAEAETIAHVLDLPEREVRTALESDGTFAFIDRQVDLESRRSSRRSPCPASVSSRYRSATTRRGHSRRRCWGS